jgi:hypothetical protein
VSCPRPEVHQIVTKEWLPIAEFAQNDAVHSATHETPFFLNYGQHPWKGQDTRKEVRNKSAQGFADRMKKVREEAEAALHQSVEKMKRNYDKRAWAPKELTPGTKVYLETTNIQSGRPSKKLDDKRFSPFLVKQKVGEAAYELKLPDKWPALHPTFNESLLTPYTPPSFSNQRRPPPPPTIEVEGQPEYVVEDIRDSQRR